MSEAMIAFCIVWFVCGVAQAVMLAILHDVLMEAREDLSTFIPLYVAGALSLAIGIGKFIHWTVFEL